MPGRAGPRHAHASLVLGVVLAGERLIQAQKATLRIHAGGGFALPPGLAHSCGPGEGGGCSYLALSLDPATMPWPVPAAALSLEPGPLPLALAALAEAMEAPAGALERQSLLAECLELLAGLCPAVPETRPGGPLAAAVELARALLDGGQAEHRGWPDIAAACGAEPLALHRAFALAMGLPPHLYQTHLRLRRAKELLRAGAGLAEAALEAGFCDQSHMHRHFVRLVGLTPAQYARAFRAAKP